MHQSAQKVANFAAQPVDRAGQLRHALSDPTLLRREAQALLVAVPAGCDLLAWSPEGATIAAVASVLAEQAGRRLSVHRASLLEPLAPLPSDDWTWLSVEEILGVGRPRTWAVEWARTHGGRLHIEPMTLAR
jgi:hypothetical protein